MISTGSVHTNLHLVLYVSECTCPATPQQLKTRQAMYCTYNVTARRVRTTFVALEKQQVLHIMGVCFSVRYPACKEHAPYCHLWPAPLYGIFPHYLINGKAFEKTLLNIKCVSWFSPQLSSENISNSKKNWVRYDQNCVLVFTHSTRYSCQSLMKLGFSQHIFEICSNVRFQEKFVQCEPSRSMRINRQKEIDGQIWRSSSRLSQFCERA